MAVWIYAYGKNGLATEFGSDIQRYIDILNSVPLDEIKILDSILEKRNDPAFDADLALARHRNMLQVYFKSMSPEDYAAQLASSNIPFNEMDKVIDHIIADNQRHHREKELDFQRVYEKVKSGKSRSDWELSGNNFFVNKLQGLDYHNGLKLSLLNDLIRISGPFPVFSVYSWFQLAITSASREYYHSYFKDVFRAFNSDFILYAHEWSGLYDDGNPEFDFAALKEQSDWENTTSDSIHTMKRFYYEQL